jgi:hypothetical protein
MESAKADCESVRQRKCRERLAEAIRTTLSPVRFQREKRENTPISRNVRRNPGGVSLHCRLCGGEGGIRTPDTLSGMPVFKTGVFNRSTTSPAIYSFTTVLILRQARNQELKCPARTGRSPVTTWPCLDSSILIPLYLFHRRLQPVEGTRYCFFPEAIKPLASCILHRWRPAAIDRPVRD